jgi:hypothetical protein
MTYGLKTFNSSGVANFDSSKYGGVVLDGFFTSFNGTTSQTYTYTVPTTATAVQIFVFPNTPAYRSDLFTFTSTVSGGVATITLFSSVGLSDVGFTFILV